jgi:lipid-A-disaccharide synthase
MHCANLIKALKAGSYGVEISGLGGDLMAAAGCQLLENMTARAAMHYNVLWQLGYYHRQKRRASAYFKSTKVDLVIVCDSPSFNFHIAKAAKKAGIPVLFYVAPQLWAWGAWRIGKMRRLCDKLACLLPFEEQWFKERGIDAEFVGNPLFDGASAELIQVRSKRGRPHGVAPTYTLSRPVIALMPGSRKGEIETLWRPMQEIAIKLRQVFAGARFIAVAAGPEIKTKLESMQIAGFGCEYDINSVISTACKADLTIVASGSATLQVAAAGSPMVIMYQSNKYLWHLIGKRLLKTRHLSLVNIIAERELVPEFMPYFDSIEPIFEAARGILEDEDIREMMSMQLIDVTEPLMTSQASKQVCELANRFLQK